MQDLKNLRELLWSVDGWQAFGWLLAVSVICFCLVVTFGWLRGRLRANQERAQGRQEAQRYATAVNRQTTADNRLQNLYMNDCTAGQEAAVQLEHLLPHLERAANAAAVTKVRAADTASGRVRFSIELNNTPGASLPLSRLHANVAGAQQQGAVNLANAQGRAALDLETIKGQNAVNLANANQPVAAATP